MNNIWGLILFTVYIFSSTEFPIIHLQSFSPISENDDNCSFMTFFYHSRGTNSVGELQIGLTVVTDQEETEKKEPIRNLFRVVQNWFTH